MREKSALCLSTGTLEFWIVDPKREVITVATRQSVPLAYTKGNSIALTQFGGGELAVSDIFALNATDHARDTRL